MAVRPGQLTKWATPFGGSELSSFYNTIDESGVLGLAVQRPDGTQESACLLVNRSEHTQSVMFELFRSGSLYEPYTTAIAVGALRSGDMAIDVGAHVGYFAVLFRLCAGERGSVLAFEPMPNTYRGLLRNVLGNRFRNLMVLPLALSDTGGEATFFLDSKNEGESSLVPRDGKSCVVQVSSLDDLFRDGLEQRPRVLKLDAEGVELKILKGGARFFASHAPDLVICEHNRGALENGGASADDLRHFFTERGYRCGIINNGHGMDMRGATFYRTIEPGEPAQPADYAYVFNLMFVREGSGLYPAPQM
ncbi:FkbM family methyltransferase [Propionivibrio soli]|uniref:FkbM family methyltransferase n=1 Tax=Propionivibrio soli TaxID=2976531 RepID=UPI0021E8773A|nr:FkbM family methyltransferase [Propionivibrio soli]